MCHGGSFHAWRMCDDECSRFGCMCLQEHNDAGGALYMRTKVLWLHRTEPSVRSVTPLLTTSTYRFTEVVRFASGLCAPYPKESRVDELKVASIATIVLMTLFLSLHLYSRWLKTQRLWSDDVYAIVAAVSR